MICVKGQGLRSEAQESLHETFDFVPLFLDVMRSQKVKQTELARDTGIKQYTLSRYLNRDSQMDMATVYAIADALKIDQLRAYMAVCQLRDWRMYHDARLIAICQFNAETLEECLKLGELEALPHAEIKELAKQSVNSLCERKMNIRAINHSSRLETARA